MPKKRGARNADRQGVRISRCVCCTSLKRQRSQTSTVSFARERQIAGLVNEVEQLTMALGTNEGNVTSFHQRDLQMARR